jgi:hypothetical protein
MQVGVVKESDQPPTTASTCQINSCRSDNPALLQKG